MKFYPKGLRFLKNILKLFSGAGQTLQDLLKIFLRFN
nr:MAG TPA: hypothetical protein [Caudoviricetes sp.]DAP25164.1 MAG TPA: hypothetical protein [Caudoviricetes sp.]